MTIEEFRRSTPNTGAMNDLSDDYLRRLDQGELDKDGQRMAAAVLGEALRRAQNTARAAQQTAAILARGLEEVRD